MSQGSAQLILAAVIIMTALFWFAPAIIAGRRRRPSRYAIFALLFFAPWLAFAGPIGWLALAIAWLVAIVWSLTGAPARPDDRAAAGAR